MHENPGPTEPAQPTSDTPPQAAVAPREEAAADPAPVHGAAPSQLADTMMGFQLPVALGPQAAPNPGPALPALVALGPQAVPNPGPALPAPVAIVPPVVIVPVAAPEAQPEPASVTFLVVVTALSLAADLVTKGWAKAALSSFDSKIHGQKRFEVWKHHLDFIFAQNPGGAWSFLRSLPDTLRRPFFLVVSAAAIVFIISIYQRVNRDQTAMKWGLPLALGGAMGNLVDRIRYGWVIDFIDFSVRWGGREHHWPTFNVADIAIVVGVVLMGLDMGRSRRIPLGMHEHAPHEAPKLGSAPLPPVA